MNGRAKSDTRHQGSPEIDWLTERNATGRERFPQGPPACPPAHPPPPTCPPIRAHTPIHGHRVTSVAHVVHLDEGGVALEQCRAAAVLCQRGVAPRGAVAGQEGVVLGAAVEGSGRGSRQVTEGGRKVGGAGWRRYLLPTLPIPQTLLLTSACPPRYATAGTSPAMRSWLAVRWPAGTVSAATPLQRSGVLKREASGRPGENSLYSTTYLQGRTVEGHMVVGGESQGKAARRREAAPLLQHDEQARRRRRRNAACPSHSPVPGRQNLHALVEV